MGFVKEEISVLTGDSWHCELLEPLEYIAKDGTYYRAITGTTTDGLSVPRAIWNVISWGDKPWKAGVLHDAAYRSTLEVSHDQGLSWVRIQLTKNQSDDLLMEAMESLGIGIAERLAIFKAVQDFGNQSFIDDLAQPITLTPGSHKIPVS